MHNCQMKALESTQRVLFGVILTKSDGARTLPELPLGMGFQAWSSFSLLLSL